MISTLRLSEGAFKRLQEYLRPFDIKEDLESLLAHPMAFRFILTIILCLLLVILL